MPGIWNIDTWPRPVWRHWWSMVMRTEPWVMRRGWGPHAWNMSDPGLRPGRVSVITTCPPDPSAHHLSLDHRCGGGVLTDHWTCHDILTKFTKIICASVVKARSRKLRYFILIPAKFRTKDRRITEWVNETKGASFLLNLWTNNACKQFEILTNVLPVICLKV